MLLIESPAVRQGRFFVDSHPLWGFGQKRSIFIVFGPFLAKTSQFLPERYPLALPPSRETHSGVFEGQPVGLQPPTCPSMKGGFLQSAPQVLEILLRNPPTSQGKASAAAAPEPVSEGF